MDEPEIYDGLQTVFNAVFRRNDILITAQLSARDVAGWDSFRHVSFIIATEEHFQVKFQSSDIDELRSVGDLARAVAERRASLDAKTTP